ncbi:uncharacterized protein A4U43_C07F29270 [Asparagus officinalis]|uniref:Uncharacterized protein n=1 Tax=Asparagus officinalis TaxID=4686 RepID=A0A5P1EIW0_ASPOF|nr:uncharacterized protein A4U43_C07F29270 [Asparagus officinalis]
MRAHGTFQRLPRRADGPVASHARSRITVGWRRAMGRTPHLQHRRRRLLPLAARRPPRLTPTGHGFEGWRARSDEVGRVQAFAGAEPVQLRIFWRRMEAGRLSDGVDVFSLSARAAGRRHYYIRQRGYLGVYWVLEKPSCCVSCSLANAGSRRGFACYSAKAAAADSQLPFTLRPANATNADGTASLVHVRGTLYGMKSRVKIAVLVDRPASARVCRRGPWSSIEAWRVSGHVEVSSRTPPSQRRSS